MDLFLDGDRGAGAQKDYAAAGSSLKTHAPGFILRGAGLHEAIGTTPSPLDSIAYAIVILSLSGIFFGIVWARTKNLFAVMFIHAATDLLPNFKEFVQTWGI
jgi:membrane protease YdiL (CAAX protease family)